MNMPLTATPNRTLAVASARPAELRAAKRGWIVTFAGAGINLALGVLYTWSLFKDAISREFGWKGEQLNDPYALCCLVFAFAMILAGHCQDKLGPRLTASIGGLLVGLGLLLISQTGSYLAWLLGFGVMVGTGIGFGYSSATPAALNWFPPAKTGLVAGLVVAGFGLAPVYLSPLSKHLLTMHGLRGAMFIYGIAFAVAVCLLAQLLASPSAGQAAAGPLAMSSKATAGADASEMLRSPTFYLLWLIYFIGAGAGLMVIGSISGMAKKSLGDAAFLAVAVMAIGNAAGRIGAGLLSDRIGRCWTLRLVLLFQALLMFLAIPVAGTKGMTGWLILLLATMIGCNYGANLSLLPAYTKDLWGLRSFGLNYGILFTAWGVGGLVLSRLQQMLTSQSGGSFSSSFAVAGGLLLAGAALTLAMKRAAMARG
jgi:MFS transporter, OFA family, oxalate/formate antiporter